MIHARLARIVGGAELSQSATGILEPFLRDAVWETLTLPNQLTSLTGKLVQIESMEIPERMRTEILTLKEQIKSPPSIQTVIGDILADTNRGTIQRSLTEIAMADSTGPTERTEFIRLAYDLHLFWVLQNKAEAMNTPDLPVLVRSVLHNFGLNPQFFSGVCLRITKLAMEQDDTTKAGLIAIVSSQSMARLTVLERADEAPPSLGVEQTEEDMGDAAVSGPADAERTSKKDTAPKAPISKRSPRRKGGGGK
eukprot:817528-Rhodomonas_salina.1